jgi:nucleoid-associated protein YgaU
MTQKFTLFLKDGTPARATVDITLEQLGDEEDFAAQNPTSGGGEAPKTRMVHAGERLDLIAYEEYEDATQWRRIAQANGLTHPLHLRPGQRLVVPPLL